MIEMNLAILLIVLVAIQTSFSEKRNEVRELGNTVLEENLWCAHGRILHDSCSCDPCWEGKQCTKYVDYYSPRFLVHKATIVVPVNVTGVVYQAWSSDEDLGLTCPLGPGRSARCPCATVKYQLFSSPGDHHFYLQSDTGLLLRHDPPTSSLQQGKTYHYKLMVQSIPMDGFTEDLLYDILDLDVFVGSPFVETIPWT